MGGAQKKADMCLSRSYETFFECVWCAAHQCNHSRIPSTRQDAMRNNNTFAFKYYLLWHVDVLSIFWQQTIFNRSIPWKKTLQALLLKWFKLRTVFSLFSNTSLASSQEQRSSMHSRSRLSRTISSRWPLLCLLRLISTLVADWCETNTEEERNKNTVRACQET